eukprot:scaffold5383_cov116-Isochrysis_galbana.AAC.3
MRKRRPLTRVPFQCPGAGCTTSPGCLSMTMQSASSYRGESGIASATSVSSRSGRRRTLSWSPTATRADFLTVSPLSWTRPSTAIDPK